VLGRREPVRFAACSSRADVACSPALKLSSARRAARKRAPLRAASLARKGAGQAGCTAACSRCRLQSGVFHAHSGVVFNRLCEGRTSWEPSSAAPALAWRRGPPGRPGGKAPWSAGGYHAPLPRIAPHALAVRTHARPSLNITASRSRLQEIWPLSRTDLRITAGPVARRELQGHRHTASPHSGTQHSGQGPLC